MDHWESVEADFQRFYGLDLRGIGLRRLRALLRGLPPESGTARIIDPQAAMWSPEVEWQVRAIEYMDVFAWRICAAVYWSFTGKQMKSIDPLRIPRPGDPPPSRGVPRSKILKLLSGKTTVVAREGGENG
jgi:hypothetical protein